ncbi:CPBP family intramembrane glutamic endopeptidase [Propionicimonas sp.]|uniref:CPBP family intramembrane glutamic endopeptidase n=1 Tax=Propionicimonas sp. TaxID=1955623 RepID=UPI001794B010|nr:CPBP family intramembrane glutamic endopeptidase [Propionicimonas sp.]MBU3975500.1 CPBP family intramembrane metalloprotease [Actinomycetota bacterium]MBA3020095.1 CPBP family intramembrane metalloprotease [Propionicimonas sp.]MBU3986351.1 CPBP family intramembrane metalloprotease [Actinomycetota bacterium]MBU4007920.1 CPBP family intramembrane metalloprotease [Actinomycetota bacterium]MBU4064178.1 CPBP family intramembrane metalloprotease [Actinomycetota bacterium]
MAEPLSATVDSAVPPSRPGIELLLVMGVSLGSSAVYSVLSIIEKLTRNVPLNQQTTSMNSAITPDRPWLDLAYQLAGMTFPLVPALLAIYLLRVSGDFGLIGFDLTRKRFDLSRGLGLAAVIGLPGIAFYLVARQLGFNTNVSPANLGENWWTVPVLIGLAVMNAVLEEVIMVGFWFVRGLQLKWPLWVVLISSALVRGSYHLYQGFGGFVGNVVMGLVFGLAYMRFKRVGPLVVAHFLLDLFAFVGYALLAPYVDWL